MSKKLGQESAYPNDGNWANGNPEQGMSKRFYAACAAMQGILSNPIAIKQESGKMHTYTSLCDMAYLCADELLKQENEHVRK